MPVNEVPIKSLSQCFGSYCNFGAITFVATVFPNWRRSVWLLFAPFSAFYVSLYRIVVRMGSDDTREWGKIINVACSYIIILILIVDDTRLFGAILRNKLQNIKIMKFYTLFNSEQSSLHSSSKRDSTISCH